MPQLLMHAPLQETPPTSAITGDGSKETEYKQEVVLQKRCQFWLPNKRRFCANTPLPSCQFCGNHNPSTGARRISCPIDPSHSVLEENLESHVKKCPFKKQLISLEGQPYYSKGINSGGSHNKEDDDMDSAAKRNSILKLSVQDFLALLEKIKSIHSAISVGFPDSHVIPVACSSWLKQQLDRKLPYQEKHAMQQVSIIGNMEAFGMLQKPKDSTDSLCQESENSGFSGDESQPLAVVEFGAGRGYLTHMLTDCYEIRKAFLVERRSYKLKADRSLRQIQRLVLERMRIDIADLDLGKVNLLNGCRYLAIGKHLCGPAIDLTINCCLNGAHSINSQLEGLAVATCCHHLCQWKHYTNKKFLLSMGITKEEFHAVTWFTSWAVDSDHNSELSDNQAIKLSVEKQKSDLECGDVDAFIRSMPALERALLGFMCKEIIDVGRLLWLRYQGMEAELVKYVPSSISPENHLLLAKILPRSKSE